MVHTIRVVDDVDLVQVGYLNRLIRRGGAARKILEQMVFLNLIWGAVALLVNVLIGARPILENVQVLILIHHGLGKLPVDRVKKLPVGLVAEHV